MAPVAKCQAANEEPARMSTKPSWGSPHVLATDDTVQTDMIIATSKIFCISDSAESVTAIRR